MEDRHTILPDFQLSPTTSGIPHQFAAVYDGHCSARGSEHAADRLHELLAEQPEIQTCQGMREVDDTAIQRAFARAFHEMDLEMVDVASAAGQQYGTTAVCALRIGRLMYIAHTGDSCALLCRGGTLVRLTEDHKPASMPTERARIEGQGGRIMYKEDRVLSNPRGSRISRLNMSRALGDGNFKSPQRLVEATPDVVRVALRPHRDQFFILASDGVLEVMSEDEAIDIVKRTVAGSPPSDALAGQAAAALIHRATALQTRDNMTAVVVLLEW
ncbi:hypothetical protein ACKKBG_A24240 [Auxenochlorella protothecoides x Auxenochlorella symbiontica]